MRLSVAMAAGTMPAILGSRVLDVAGVSHRAPAGVLQIHGGGWASQVAALHLGVVQPHGQSAVLGGAELIKPASSRGYLWLWAARRSPEEPPSHSACPEKLRCRRQAVPKSLILLRLTTRRDGPAHRQRRPLGGRLC